MKIMVLEGHLLNHHLDRMHEWELARSSSAAAAAAATALAEACMSLAALYWVRRAAHERMDAGSKLEEAGSWAFDMSRAVATALRDLDARILQLETSPFRPPAETQVRSAQDRLWCLFWAEQNEMQEDMVIAEFDTAGKNGFDGTEDVEVLVVDVLVLELDEVEKVVKRVVVRVERPVWLVAAEVELEETVALLVAEERGRRLVVKPVLLEDSPDLDVLVLVLVLVLALAEDKVLELVPDDVTEVVEGEAGDEEVAKPAEVVVLDGVVVLEEKENEPGEIDEVVGDAELVLLRIEVVEVLELVGPRVVNDEAERVVVDKVEENPDVVDELRDRVETVVLNTVLEDDWLKLETKVLLNDNVAD
ncbi:hypothetical protein CLAIMM_07012 [Cladophialophora immunda]|nr:hypothetical protein CLAIMM_07012 [Cladophialophora immunda]